METQNSHNKNYFYKKFETLAARAFLSAISVLFAPKQPSFN
jgi:hypothetical protein